MRQRTCLVAVRLTQAEYDQLKALAEEQGITMPAVLRRLALGIESDE